MLKDNQSKKRPRDRKRPKKYDLMQLLDAEMFQSDSEEEDGDGDEVASYIANGNPTKLFKSNDTYDIS